MRDLLVNGFLRFGFFLIACGLAFGEEKNDEVYYQALEQHEAAIRLSSEELYEKALGLYGEYLKENPESAAAYYNSAQVYRSKGDAEMALESLSQAVEFGDEHQAFYLEAYADLLGELGRWAEACRFYTEALVLDFGDEGLSSKLLASYGNLNCDSNVRLSLWKMLNSGQSSRPRELALASLRQGCGDEEELYMLWSAYIAALALQYESVDPWRSEDKRHIEEIASIARSRPELEGSAEELLKLLQGDYELSTYSWWRSGQLVELDDRMDYSPLDAFHDLCRSFSRQARWSNRDDAAIGFLELAGAVVPIKPDLKALKELVTYFADEERLESTYELVAKYENEFFQAKGNAYREKDYDLVYDFHTALGAIYTALNRIGSPGQQGTAIYQLERAHEVALRSRNGSGSVIVESPLAVKQLAEAYWKLGMNENAANVLLESAELYREEDRFIESQQLASLYKLPIIRFPWNDRSNTIKELRSVAKETDSSGYTAISKNQGIFIDWKNAEYLNLDSSEPSYWSTEDRKSIARQAAKLLVEVSDDKSLNRWEALAEEPELSIKEVSFRESNGQMIFENKGRLAQVPIVSTGTDAIIDARIFVYE